MRISVALLGTPSASFELSLPPFYTALRICTCSPCRFLPRIPQYLKIAPNFRRTPRVLTGHDENWSLMEKILHADSSVYAVAVSADGGRIVSGLGDGTIQVRDAETGETLSTPFQGHTEWVRSVVLMRVLVVLTLLVSYFLFGLQCISIADNTLEALTRHIIFISLPVVVLGGERH